MKLFKRIKNFRISQLSPQFKFIATGVLCYLAVLAIIVFLVFPKVDIHFRVGDVASRDYSAPHDVEFVNSRKTEEKKQQVLDQIQTYYLIDESVNERYFARLYDFFETVKSIEPDDEPLYFNPLGDLLEKEYWKNLEAHDFKASDIWPLISMSDNELDNFKRQLAEIQLEILSETITPKQVADLQTEIITQVRAKGVKPALQNTSEKIIQAFTGSNTIIDVERTNREREQILDTFQPVTEKLIKGEVYLRDGDVITQRHLDILNTIYRPEPRKEARERLKKIITLCLLVLAAFILFWYFMDRLAFNPLADERLYYILLLQTIFTIFGGVVLSRLVSGNELIFYLLIPLIVNAWVLAYFISSPIALMSTLFNGAFFAIAFSLDRTFLLTTMLTAVISSFLINRDCRHSELFRGIIFVGLIGTLMNIAVILLYNDPIADLLNNTRLIWFSSIAVVPIMIALSWLFVFMFKVVTWYYLNELTDVNHPLIKLLRHNSPGSYHHSLMVGDIGEIAADAVGANGLLVRVGALYHDIGKAKMPHFYIENQPRDKNPHDRYPPSLSRLIVLSHVKDGVQMARKAGLPKEIIDSIQQHQGTTLMKYFFRKALAKSDGEPIDEYDYRYEGPIPQYPEMAILSFADSSESAVRSLDEPTPHRIETIVNALFQDRLLDGQFNDSQMTISELITMKDTLISTLSGIYHSRIDYPDVKELKQQFQDKEEAETDDTDSNDSSDSDNNNNTKKE